MIGLTQGGMDLYAAHTMALLPSELLTYTAQATGDATPRAWPEIRGHIAEYRQHEVRLDPMLRNQRKLRITPQDIPVTPTRNDTVTRADGTVWTVEAVDGGPGRPWWLLQIHQVG